jgi:hypothetical protein
MGNALRMGLAGGLMGAMQGQLQKVQEEEYQLRTERALAAKAAMEERIASIKAEYDVANDEREHSNKMELEEAKAVNAGALKEEEISAADRRAAENNASRERAAQIRASTPKGGGPSFRTARLPDSDKWGYVDPATGEFSKNAEGALIEAPPPYRERQGGASKDAPKPAPPPPPKPDPNAPPVEGAKKARDGLWYVQQGGTWFKVEQ